MSSTHHGARLVIILGALGAFASLSIDMYLPALPTLGRDFGASAPQIQLTLSACLLGLALGQVIAGPLSDALGRRWPLLIGIAVYAVASLLCVVAPSVSALVLLRFVQGAAGAAGIVIASAVVRDLHSGVAAARFFSLLLLVTGVAPVLAPIVGGQLLRLTSWRGIFMTLALISTLIFLAVLTSLDETLPVEARQSGGVRATLRTFRRLLADRAFVGYVLASGLAFGAVLAYSSGSPFVLQNIYGVSPQRFSVLYSMNALGFVVASQVNGQLVGRVAPRQLLIGGLLTMACGGIALLAVIMSGIGLVGVLLSMFTIMTSLGFILPNVTTLALAGDPRSAGSAAALLGLLQFAFGAITAPLVGVGGSMTALPMAVVVATCGVCALAAGVLIGQGSGRQPDQDRGVQRDHAQDGHRLIERARAVTPINIVTLSREYGSGGGEIAARLAHRLDWQLLDREVAVRVAQKLGIGEDEIDAYDERVESLATRILDTLGQVQPMFPIAVEVPLPLNARAIHEARRQVIEGATAVGQVVIVGRGAQAHLTHRRDMFHVRIVAPLEARIAYVMHREDRDQAAARARISRKDEERSRYLRTFYQRDPSDPHLYDVIVNTAILDLDSAVDVIALALERKARCLARPEAEFGPMAGLARYPGSPEDV
jgi:MFS transporter, DHA1 family, multidrug resistance protein